MANALRASELSDAELQTLATGIKASTDPVVVAALAIRDDVTLQKWCNANASPVVKCWRESVQPQEMDEAPDYTVFDAISAGKRDSWGYLLRYARDFSKQKFRKWVTDVWGSATAGSSAESILLAGTENMRAVEKIMGPGTLATTGTVSANKRDWTGTVSITEVSTALNRF